MNKMTSKLITIGFLGLALGGVYSGGSAMADISAMQTALNPHAQVETTQFAVVTRSKPTVVNVVKGKKYVQREECMTIEGETTCYPTESVE
jgi:hypothetical protein